MSMIIQQSMMNDPLHRISVISKITLHVCMIQGYVYVYPNANAHNDS